MRVTDIVNSAKLTVGQIFSCPTVQHFQFELLRVSAALTHETGTAMVLVCRHPTSDEAVSDAVFGCEDFVSPFAREVVPNHFQFEPEVEFPHMPSKVVSNSWGSVQTRGDSACLDRKLRPYCYRPRAFTRRLIYRPGQKWSLHAF